MEKETESLDDLYCLFGKEKRKITGQLHGIKRDRTSNDLLIPSIPNLEQSFGYRIDPKTNTLLLNENPNVLLAKKEFLSKFRRLNEE